MRSFFRAILIAPVVREVVVLPEAARPRNLSRSVSRFQLLGRPRFRVPRAPRVRRSDGISKRELVRRLRVLELFRYKNVRQFTEPFQVRRFHSSIRHYKVAILDGTQAIDGFNSDLAAIQHQHFLLPCL